MMKIRPSELFFSQDTIANKWGKQTACRSKLIGVTLDELLTKSISLKDIPNINAVNISGKFYTVDNRRLWVFQKAEELGFVHEIEVNQVPRRHLKRAKLTTDNEGISIRIRGSGDPGGTIWRKWTQKTSQEVDETSVSSFALYAHETNDNESKTNANQYSFSNKRNTEAEHSSTNKSLYNDYNSAKPDVRFAIPFSSNCESPVFDNEIQLKGNYFLESALHVDNTFSRVQEPVANQSRTNNYQYSFFNKTNTEARHQSTHKLPYNDNNSAKADDRCTDVAEAEYPRKYNSAKHDVRSDITFSSNCESPVSDIEIQNSIIQKLTTKEKPTLKSKSSFESTHVSGAVYSYSRSNVKQYSFVNGTEVEAQHQSTYKSSDNSYNSVESDVLCAFTGNCKAVVSNKNNQHASTKTTTAEEEAHLGRKYAYKSGSDKTSSGIQRPVATRGKTNSYFFFNKMETTAESQSTYKSSHSRKKSVKPDVQCENDFLIDSESSVSDKKIQCSSISRSTAKEEPTLRRKYTSESISDKTRSDVHGSVVNERSTHVNPYSFRDQTETKAETQSTYTSSHSKYNSVKPDVQYEKAFSIDSESSVSDNKIQFSRKDRPTDKEDPTLRRKYTSKPISDKKSSDVNGPVVNQCRTNFDQSSFINKTETKTEPQSSYKSSHNRYNSVKPDVQCEHPFSIYSKSSVSDKETTCSSMNRSTDKDYLTRRREYTFESTSDKTRSDVKGPVVNERKTHINLYSFLDQTETKAEPQSTYKSSYNRYNSIKPDVQCEHAFSINRKSSVSDKETTCSSMNRSTDKDYITRRREYTFESISDKTRSDVHGPVVNERRTHVNPYSFLDHTETKAEPQSSYKSSHSRYNSIKPDVQCENVVSIDSESSVLDNKIQFSRKNRSTDREDPTLRRKYTSESISDKKSSDVNGPVVNQSRTNLNQSSFVNKTETEAKPQSAYKSSHSRYNYVKPDVQCENAFSINIKSSVSDKETTCSSMNRSTDKEDPTLRRKYTSESISNTKSLEVNGPVVNQSRTNLNKSSSVNKTETEAKPQSAYKSSHSRYNSVKPDVQCENDFSMNIKSSVSDKETTCSSMNRSTAREEPTLRRKYTSESISDRTRSDVHGPVVNERRTYVNLYSFLDQTETKAEPQSTYKSSHSRYNSVKPDVQCKNAFSIDSESSVLDNKIQFSRKNRSTGKEDPTLRRKYTSESISDKKSSDVNGPVVNQSRTNLNQSSFVNKTETEAKPQSAYKSSHSRYNSVKPDVQCENAFSINIKSSVSDKETTCLSMNRSTAKEEPTLRRKYTSESISDKTRSDVHGPVVNERRTHVNLYSFLDQTETKAEPQSTYKSSYSRYNSVKPDVQCDNVVSIDSESSVLDNKIQFSRKNRSTDKEDPILRRKYTSESISDKKSSDVNGPVVNQSRNNFNQSSFVNKTNTEAQPPSTYEYLYSNCNSSKFDVRRDTVVSFDCESMSSTKKCTSKVNEDQEQQKYKTRKS